MAIHKDRALWVALVVLLLAFAAFMLRETGGTGWLPGCFFKKYTGLDCPGCGMTRATNAMLHGDLAASFRFNPVGMILLPLAAIGVGIEVLGWVRGKPLPFRFRIGKWGAIALVVIMVLWWVLRNLYWKL